MSIRLDLGDTSTSPGWHVGETIQIQAGHRVDYCPWHLEGAHDFDAHTVDGLVISMHCRRCGLILPEVPE